jgi:hypothetical protein
MDFFELRMDVEWYRYLAAYGKKEENKAELQAKEHNVNHKNIEEERQDTHHRAA